MTTNYWVWRMAMGALLGSGAVSTAVAQVRRTVMGLQIRPEVQGELALKKSSQLADGQVADYLLVALRGQRQVDIASRPNDGRSLGFDERRIMVGYEHFWEGEWSGGATTQLYSLGNDRLVVVPEILLRHRSPIKTLVFGQRLSVERTFPNNAGFAGGAGPDGENWIRLRVDLEKAFPLGHLHLRPRLSYEAATHLRLQKAEEDPDERFIQFTNLRAEVGCRMANQFDFTPWFAYQTSYLLTLPQFDALGNQTSGGKLNAVTPVLGLDVRFTLKGEGVQQLPTQH